MNRILMTITSNFQDMKKAIDTLNGFELNGKRIKVIEEAKSRQQSCPGGSRSRSKSPRSRRRSRSRSASAGEVSKRTDGTICEYCNDTNEYFRICCVTCNDAKPIEAKTVDEIRKTKGAIPAIKSGNLSQLKIITDLCIV